MSWLLGAGFVLASLIFGIGVSDGNIGRWTVIHFGAIAGLLAWSYYAVRGEIRIPHLLWYGLPLALFSLLSLLWAADWLNGVDEIKNYYALAVWALVMPFIRHRYIPAFITVAAVSAVAMNYIYPQSDGGFGNENFISEYLTMALPFVVLSAYRWRWMLSAPFIVAWGLWGADSHAPLGAAVLVLLGWLVYSRRWLSATALVAAVTVAITQVWALEHSVVTRAELFINSLAAWWDSPVYGYGIGSFNFIYPLYAEVHTAFLGDRTLFGTPWQFAGSAHNDLLTLMVELGLVGVLCLAPLWLVNSERRGRHLHRLSWTAEQRAALWCLSLCGGLAMFGFPLRTPGTALMAAVCLGMLCPGYTFHRVRWLRLSFAPALCVAGLLGYASLKNYEAEIHFQQTISYIGSRPIHALGQNMEAYRIYPYARRYRHQLMLTTQTLASKHDIMISSEAADEIYKVARSAGNDASVLMARLEFLLSTGLHAGTDEDERLVAELQRRARLQEETQRYAAKLSELHG